ncbi:Beta-glucosidase A [subsurface metagenome]
MYHWTLPVWFAKKGGWLNKKAPDDFARYVEFVVKNLSDVKFWITINEPNIYTSHSFLRGDWPPFKKLNTQKALKQLEIAHKKSYKIIHKIHSNARVGIAKNNIDYKGILKLLVDYKWNHKFLKSIKNYQDFIGLNYYFTQSLLNLIFPAKKERATDMGWRIVPRGIYRVLKNLEKYNRPIYITENGLADADDSRRTDFIKNHLKWIHKAIEEGIDVKGYFYWSLLDNFEWDKGFKPRFGLIEIDYKTLKRKPRPSSKVYAKICGG